MLDNTYLNSGKKSGVYIHVPFCHSKCLYCDFYSGGIKNKGLMDSYVDALCCEMTERKSEINDLPDSLYIGGGTPSLLDSVNFQKLTDSFNKNYPEINNIKEFTIEVNPEDVTVEKCKLWKDSGVNRISMGIQSLNDEELRIIGRRHSAKKAIISYEILRSFFDNISVDLIFGLPSQTVNSLSENLNEILSLQPDHISVYNLMLEQGTALNLLFQQGKIDLPEEDEVMKMWELVIDNLCCHGFYHYEISNFSLPGFESYHNNKYWDSSPYIGFGPSAHSYDGYRIRRANRNDLKGYIKIFGGKGRDINNENKKTSDDRSFPFYTEEILSSEELSEEMIFTRLRRSKGLDLKEFSSTFGTEKKRNLIIRAEPYIKDGFLAITGDSLKLTRKGIFISDSIFSNLI